MSKHVSKLATAYVAPINWWHSKVGEQINTKPPAEPDMAKASDAEVQEAARRQAELLRSKRRGMSGTILTGPMGVSEGAATRKTILG